MKKLCIVILVIILIVTVNACSKKAPNNEDIDMYSKDQYLENADAHLGKEDVQYIKEYMSITDDIMISTRDAVLTLSDISEKEASNMYVCSIPGCLHNNDDCTARKYAGEFPLIYKDRIYILTCYGDTVLYSMRIDGTDIKQCFAFEDDAHEPGLETVRIGEKLYIPIEHSKSRLDTESGYVDTEYIYMSIYEYDLESGVLNEVYTGHKGYGGGYNKSMYYSNGKLAFSYAVRKNNYKDLGYTISEYFDIFFNGTLEEQDELISQFEFEVYVCLLDISDYTITEFTPEWNMCAYFDGRFLIEKYDRSIWWYDYESGEMTEINSDLGFLSAEQMNGVLIIETSGEYSDNYSVNNYTFYFEDGTEPMGWTRTRDNNFSIECPGNKKLYVSWSPLVPTSTSEEWEYEFIDRGDLFK